jgi:hypothetical protein
VIPVTIAALTDPSGAGLDGAAAVFDQYRQHYGQAVVPGQALTWLRHYIDSGRLDVFTARIAEDLVGLATAVSIPASLTLSFSWLCVLSLALRHGGS